MEKTGETWIIWKPVLWGFRKCWLIDCCPLNRAVFMRMRASAYVRIHKCMCAYEFVRACARVCACGWCVHYIFTLTGFYNYAHYIAHLCHSKFHTVWALCQAQAPRLSTEHTLGFRGCHCLQLTIACILYISLCLPETLWMVRRVQCLGQV